MDPKKLKKENKRLSKALTQKDKALLRLQRENNDLKRRLAEAQGAYEDDDEFRSSKKRHLSPEMRKRTELMRLGQINARRFSKKSYFRYLIQSVKDSAIGFYIQKISGYIRRLRLIRTVAAILSALVIALLLSAFFITILPFLLLLAIIALTAIGIRAGAANRRISEALRDKRVRVVIFPDEITFRDDTFMERSAMSMAEAPDTVIICVSPHFFSTKGLGGRGMFFTARQERPHLFLVRRGYYFILRRRVLDLLPDGVTVLY